MKKLVIGLILLAATSEAQSVNTCVNAAGNARAPLCDANNNLQVNVQGSTSRVCVAITPDTNAFAANDIIGPSGGASGLLTFAAALRPETLSGILQSIVVTNTEVDSIPFDFCLFSADPASSTVTSNQPLTLATTDMQKLIGCFPVADGRAFATNEQYQAQGINMSVKAAATTVYGILRTTGTPTWASDQTINVCLTFVQD